MDIHRALTLNREWHSRLPELTNWQGCLAFGAECSNVTYAVALWGQPVARMLNGRGWIELRRMAIADDAPKNTASRMIGWMLRELRKDGRWVKAISYQDTAVHAGTIYKASGWKVGNRSEGGEWSRPSRGRDKVQTASEKVRWEYDFPCTPNGPGLTADGADVRLSADAPECGPVGCSRRACAERTTGGRSQPRPVPATRKRRGNKLLS